MADSVQEIGRLLPLLEMTYQAEQQKMAKVVERISILRQQLNELERPKSDPSGQLNAATLAGADILWEAWAQDRKALINRELAIALRDQEHAKDGLIRALSKFEAAKEVKRQATAAAKQIRYRRSSW